MAMFDKHLKRKVIIMFVVYRGHSDPYEPVTEWDFGVDTQPKDNIDNDDANEDDYLRNLEPQNEHVGVHEETMYCDIVAPNALQVVHSPIQKEPSYVVDDNEDDSEGGDESQDEEDIPCNEQNYAPNVGHDLEDPPMVVGSTYANMYTFKLVISQHAIKNQFEFNTAKSAPNRFMAYCSRRDKDNYPWWIFASTTKDNCTVMVRLCLCPYVN